MGVKEEIIQILEEADRTLSDSEITTRRNERRPDHKDDTTRSAMWNARDRLRKEGIIEGRGNNPTRWLLTNKEYDHYEESSRGRAATEASTRLEKSLEKDIYENLSSLESGLKRATEEDNRQRQVASGRLDILAEDESNRLVVIEIKTGKAKREVIGQTMAYMSDINKNFPEREVRGIIVADSFSDKLTAAVSFGVDVQLYNYERHVQFTFEQVN